MIIKIIGLIHVLCVFKANLIEKVGSCMVLGLLALGSDTGWMLGVLCLPFVCMIASHWASGGFLAISDSTLQEFKCCLCKYAPLETICFL